MVLKNISGLRSCILSGNFWLASGMTQEENRIRHADTFCLVPVFPDRQQVVRGQLREHLR